MTLAEHTLCSYLLPHPVRIAICLRHLHAHGFPGRDTITEAVNHGLVEQVDENMGNGVKLFLRLTSEGRIQLSGEEERDNERRFGMSAAEYEAGEDGYR